MGASIQSEITKLNSGFKGQQADSNPTRSSNEVAGSTVNVGTFAKLDENGLVVPLSATGETVDGLIAKSDLHTVDTIASGENVTLQKGGNFYVYCETAITKGAKLFVRHTPTDGETIGDVRADADTDKADENANIVAGETLSEAGILKVSIDL